MKTTDINIVKETAKVTLTKENVKDILFGLYELRKHYHDSELWTTLDTFDSTKILEQFSKLFDALYWNET